MVDIPNYEGLYKIDVYGNIYSVKREIMKKKHISRGYFAVVLVGKDCKLHHEFVHRLLAKTFIKNERNLPCVNHKDEDKLNNDLSNLEWCTVAYNNTYNDLHKRNGKKISVAIQKNGGAWNKGKKGIASQETRKKISDSCKGRPFQGNQYTKIKNQ